jgi:hypothetical protein
VDSSKRYLANVIGLPIVYEFRLSNANVPCPKDFNEVSFVCKQQGIHNKYGNFYIRSRKPTMDWNGPIKYWLECNHGESINHTQVPNPTILWYNIVWEWPIPNTTRNVPLMERRFKRTLSLDSSASCCVLVWVGLLNRQCLHRRAIDIISLYEYSLLLIKSHLQFYLFSLILFVYLLAITPCTVIPDLFHFPFIHPLHSFLPSGPIRPSLPIWTGGVSRSNAYLPELSSRHIIITITKPRCTYTVPWKVWMLHARDGLV